MEPERGHGRPELPLPTLWPVGVAVGVACLLLGLVIDWVIAAVGAGITLAFGFLWVREVTAGYRTREAPPPPAAAPPTVAASAPAHPEPAGIPRKKFLEGATLGLGAVIGGIVTVPSVYLAIIPPFLKQGHDEIDLGPLESYPEGEYVVATFLEEPEHGEVSRRTAFVRYNGFLENPKTGNEEPSFTVVSNRCAHLGCPTQPSGPVEEERQKVVKTEGGEVTLIPTQPAGFSCPCHGGAYDTEGNRTAGPPVRALDRYDFSIRKGRLYIGKTYSVSQVDGAGANAKIRRYRLAGPGQHVDGWEQVFYPIQPPR